MTHLDDEMNLARQNRTRAATNLDTDISSQRFQLASACLVAYIHKCGNQPSGKLAEWALADADALIAGIGIKKGNG